MYANAVNAILETTSHRTYAENNNNNDDDDDDNNNNNNNDDDDDDDEGDNNNNNSNSAFSYSLPKAKARAKKLNALGP